MQETATIDLDVRSLSKLLDIGSSPVLSAHIHPDAAEILEERAMEHPTGTRFKINIASEDVDLPTETVRASVHGHFSARGRQARRMLAEHRRNGLKTLAVAAVVVTVLFLALESLHALGELRIYRLLSGSMVIITWVTLWIPVESLIFDSLKRRRRLARLEALAEADVHCSPRA